MTKITSGESVAAFALSALVWADDGEEKVPLDKLPKAVLEAVKTIGERSGFDVVCCPDGESGVEVSRARRPDLVMVDLRMPGLSNRSRRHQDHHP